MKPDIVRRYSHNPILTKADIPYAVETVHNAAVVKRRNEYIMLFRSHLRTGGRSLVWPAALMDSTSPPIHNPFWFRPRTIPLQPTKSSASKTLG